MNVRKVFLAPLHYDHQQEGMIHAFQSLFGPENVRVYDYLSRLKETNWGMEYVQDEVLEQAREFQPDWAWFQLQNSDVVKAKTLGKIRKAAPGCLLTHWSGDVREELTEYFESICAATDITFAANVGFLEKYLEAGAPEVAYVAHGLDWFEDVMGLPEWEPPFEVPDVVYCGNHYGDKVVGTEAREGAVRALHEAGIRVGVVGRGWEKTGLPVLGECAVKQQVHVYRRAKVALSVNHYPDLPGYHGDRTITAMASGTPVVQRHFPLIEKEFTPGVDLEVFRDAKGLVRTVSALLESEERRRELGAAGRRRALRDHTWFSRILQVLPLVEERRRERPAAPAPEPEPKAEAEARGTDDPKSDAGDH